SALVPFTNVRQRLEPTVAAHFFSNSETTPARDQTPLRMTSSRRFSSVAGFHIGHFCQPLVRTGVPPRTAGVLFWKTLPVAVTEGARPSPTAAPRPMTVFCLMKERLEYSFFDMIIIFIWFIII